MSAAAGAAQPGFGACSTDLGAAQPGYGVCSGDPGASGAGAGAGAVTAGADGGGCLTCGDVAVPLTVVEIAGPDACCRDAAGRTETVAVELVGPVGVGDRLLVHAGVAIEVLGPGARPTGPEA